SNSLRIPKRSRFRRSDGLNGWTAAVRIISTGPLAQSCEVAPASIDLRSGEWRNLADAQDSGSCEGNLMGVQVPPRPPVASMTATRQSPQLDPPPRPGRPFGERVVRIAVFVL